MISFHNRIVNQSIILSTTYLFVILLKFMTFTYLILPGCFEAFGQNQVKYLVYNFLKEFTME